MASENSEINLIIDGKEITTQPGNTILQAAMESGLYIPYLCYYPGMKPYGACRMCVVEVENGRGTPASCTTPVSEGMVVNTDTQQIQDLRKGITELIISEHPHGCLTCHRTDINGANLCGPEDICLRHVSVTDRCVSCPKNERCELKDTTIYVGTGLTTPMTYKYRNLPVLNQDPFYDLDYNLCIVCARCVRACDELRGDNAITLTERSGISLVGPAYGSSLLESGCEFCGSCIDVCPVGALVESDYKWDKAVESTSTTCPQCPVGCQLKLEVNKRGKVIRVIPELEAEANRGQACFKGKFGLDFINKRSRLKSPMIRREGVLEDASWEEAMSYVADKLNLYKGSGFAALSSARSTNEEAYILQKFTRSVMNSNNVDHSSNMRPEITEILGDVLGYQAATNSIWSIEESDCILVVSSNVTEEHNVASVAVKRGSKNGSKLIVIDSREVELTRSANLWLRPRPGTDSVLLGGILKVIFDEALEDQEFMNARTQNLDNFKNSLWKFDLKKVQEITGVDEADIRTAARHIAESDSTSFIYALDNLDNAQRSESTRSVINLALATGNIGNNIGGIYPLRSGTNDQGSWDVGCVPHLLPGYRNLNDSSARENLEQSWGLAIPEETGLGLKEMFPAITSGDVKAMMIVGSSTNFSNGELGDILESVKNLEFLVVQDAFLTDVGMLADVVLPSVTFAEKEGTFTNMERRVQPLRQVLEINNTYAMPDWWIITELAKAMGYNAFDYHCAAQILDEISNNVPFYAGIKYDRLLSKEGILEPAGIPNFPIPSQMIPASGGRNTGIQWPCLDVQDAGGKVLYANSDDSSRFSMQTLEIVDGTNLTTKDYPLLFVPGRVLHNSDDVKIEVINNKNIIVRDEVLQLNPEDAKHLDIRDFEKVQLESANETLTFQARIVEESFVGVVSSTALFGSLITQLDASEDPDPMGNVPTLITKAVRVSKQGS